MSDTQKAPRIDWQTGTQEEASLARIRSGETNGYIFPDFLNADEVSRIKEGFRACSEEELIKIHAGFTSFPMSFAQFDQMQSAGILTEEAYCSVARSFATDFSQRFGVDVLGKLRQKLQQLDAQIELQIPLLGENRPFVPFTFRELFPGEGKLKAHCENLFFQEFPGFFERINRFSIKKDQLSFFIVLEKAGEGGELTLYNLWWNDDQRRMTDVLVRVDAQEVISIEDETRISRTKYHPEVGSLVLFSGGEIWHRVETIKANPARLTLGGFLSFSPDYSTLFCWS
jgi:hypothetical protein